MNAKRYLRGMVGQGWYNFTECLAWAILYRKMPEELEYCHKVAYGPKKREWINTISRKDLAGQKKPLFVYIHGGGWVSGVTDMRNTYIMNWAKKGFLRLGRLYLGSADDLPGQVQEECMTPSFILDHAGGWLDRTTRSWQGKVPAATMSCMWVPRRWTLLARTGRPQVPPCTVQNQKPSSTSAAASTWNA